MRAQSSIEFVVILSGIISLVAVSAGLYLHQAAYQKLALEEIANVSNSTRAGSGNYTIQPRMYVYASVGNVTYLNATNPLEVVVSLPAGSEIDSVVASSRNAVIEPAGFYNVSTSGISDFSFKAVPDEYGAVNISVETHADYNGRALANSTWAYTFAASAQGANATRNSTGSAGTLRAVLSYGNQGILYGLSRGTDIISARTSNHCLYQNFWYRPYPVSVQCGTGDAWDFWIFDSACYSRGDLYRVYCVYPENSTYVYYGISNKKNYSYNVTLRLYNSSVEMAGSMSQDAGAVNLTHDGNTYGNAIVAGVTGQGPEPYAGYVILGNGSGAGAVNISAYDEYSQALESMRSTLSYYNNTGITQDQIDQIWQEMGSYGKEASAFDGTPYSNVSGCGLEGGARPSYYACTPYSDLDYVIDATIIGSAAYNYSAEYMGSAINIRNGSG